MKVRLLVEVEPDPYEEETPQSLRRAVDAALNECHVHGTSKTAAVTLLAEEPT